MLERAPPLCSFLNFEHSHTNIHTFLFSLYIITYGLCDDYRPLTAHIFSEFSHLITHYQKCEFTHLSSLTMKKSEFAYLIPSFKTHFFWWLYINFVKMLLTPNCTFRMCIFYTNSIYEIIRFFNSCSMKKVSSLTHSSLLRIWGEFSQSMVWINVSIF